MGVRILPMDAKKVEKLLKKYGFELVSQKGSHKKWRNSQQNLQVIVPYHQGRDLPIGTLRNIFVNSSIPEFEWKK